MTMNEKDIKRHLEAASRIKTSEDKVRSDLEQIRKNLNQQNEKTDTARQTPAFTFAKFIRYAAVFVAAVTFGLIAHYGLPFDGTTIAWADVVEKFKSVEHFSAVFYIKESISEEPQQVEIWAGSSGKARLRVGHQVLFGSDGEVIAGFDFVENIELNEEQFDSIGEKVIYLLGQSQPFSIDTIVKSISANSQLQDVTPVVNDDESISEDMIVFDLGSASTPEWFRIWALKNSRLPVRMCEIDPRGYGQVECVFTYSKPQSDEFFDPDTYRAAIKDSRGKTNRAYALMHDPAGQDLTPLDTFNKTGYHMPDLEDIGITENGAVWIISTNSSNNRPDGYTFYGYRELKDDLDRRYISLYLSHSPQGNRTVEIFVPQNYPFDERVPNKLILPCKVEENHPDKIGELIGTEEVTEWKQDSPCPKQHYDRSEFSLMLTMAGRYCTNMDFDKCEEIFEMIKNAGQYINYQERINWVKLSILKNKGLYDQAAEFAMQLWPAQMKRYTNPTGNSFPSIIELETIIAAVAVSGDIDKAKQLWDSVRDTEPGISHFSKGAQEHARENIKRQFDEPAILVIELQPHLSVEDISKIVGFDVTKHERFRHYDFKTAEQMEKDRKTKEYMQKLFEYYDTHPLPEKFEIFEKDQSSIIKKLEPGTIFTIRQIPSHEDYYIWPVNSSLESIAEWAAKFSTEFIPKEIVEIQITEDSEEILSQQIKAEIVYHKSVTAAERFIYLANLYLHRNGLELIKKDGPMKTVFVAKYDGRKLKNFEEVTGTPEEDVRGKPGYIGMMAGNGISMQSHLSSLAAIQNRDLGPNDEKLIISDETGLEGPVSIIGKHFPGKEGLKLAKEWFSEEFGVTLHEEQRSIPVWQVRRIDR